MQNTSLALETILLETAWVGVEVIWCLFGWQQEHHLVMRSPAVDGHSHLNPSSSALLGVFGVKPPCVVHICIHRMSSLGGKLDGGHPPSWKLKHRH